MGGSVARGLAQVEARPEVVAWSREPEDLAGARDAGVVDRVAESPRSAAAAGRLVIYAVPLGPFLDMLPVHVSLWRDDAVVTDVTSLKAPVMRRLAGLGGGAPDPRFVGSHPLTGGTGTGFAASSGELYRDARVFLAPPGDPGPAGPAGAGEAAPVRREESPVGTAEAPGRPGEGPDGAAGPRPTAVVTALWQVLGARVETLDPAEHDRRMVWASHLPQLVATALARVLEEAGVARTELGPGGRDMTRLAASGPGMWRDLLAEAAEADARALDRLGGLLVRMAADLRRGRTDTVETLMTSARRWAEEPTP
jgi:prephenate dehydrogenase